MKIKLLLVVIFLFTLLTTSFAQDWDKAKLDKFLDTLNEKNKAMGSLAIAKDGKIVYSRAIGYSRINEKDKKTATVETKYRIGSISKTFTAVMIFQLAEEGKLKLTETLDKYFPQIPNASKITIAQMLAHRSGIHSFTSDADFPSWLMNPKTQSELVGIIAKGNPDFEPDAKASYSNANYILLGFIVEKAGKKPYQTALKERITSKIGLTNTYLGGKTDVTKNETYSYSLAKGWKQSVETDLSIPGGAGALVSTPTDLTKFIQALFDLKLIRQTSLDQMKSIRDGYGLGIFPFPLNGKTVYGHTGGIDEFSSMLIYSPEERLAVAVISNGAVYSVNNVMLGATSIYNNQPFTIPVFVDVSAEVLDKYAGVYSNPNFPLRITVTREGTELFGQATGQSAFPLEATSQNSFKYEPSGIVIEFNAESKQMTLKQGGRETVFTKEK